MNDDMKITIAPDAWATTDQTVGPRYGKVTYDKLPIQSLNPLHYTHEKLFSEKSVIGLMKAAYYDGYSEREKEVRQQLAEAQAEVLEQARIVGMGGEREIDLRQKLDIVSSLLREASGRMNYGHWSSEFRGRVEKALKLKGY